MQALAGITMLEACQLPALMPEVWMQEPLGPDALPDLCLSDVDFLLPGLQPDSHTT